MVAFKKKLQCLDERIILKWILKKLVSLRGIGLIRQKIELIGEPCKFGIESSGSIRHGDLLILVQSSKESGLLKRINTFKYNVFAPMGRF